jgi:protein-L-isoaspartate(D-aspartate) O-methyltransferase
MFDYRAARLTMVETQLRTNKVTDEAVLDAFLTVPRERFVPEGLRGIAYVDDVVPLGGGRFVLPPMVLARLLQLAAIAPGDGVLEIGCATGYATALLARLAARVVAVECDGRLAAQARARLDEQQADSVRLIEGPLEDGYPAGAPYDVILINGGAAMLPDSVARQLAEGGRLVTVMRSNGAMGQAVLVTRVAGIVSRRPVFDAGAAVLPGFEPAPGFVF